MTGGKQQFLVKGKKREDQQEERLKRKMKEQKEGVCL